MRILLVLALFVWTTPALAQQVKVEAQPLSPLGSPKQTPGSPPQADAEEKPATAEEQAMLLCQTREIMGSTSDANVPGPDYQPGVDAYGRSVTPPSADAPGQIYSIPDEIEIPLNIQILQTVGIAPSPDLSTNVGTITIKKGGQILYNNQDMTSTVQKYCNKQDVKVTP